MSDIDRLLRVFTAYSDATGLSEARVSTIFLKGGARIAALRSGGDMGSRTIARAIEAFSAAWPADAPWPADVPRPVPPTAGPSTAAAPSAAGSAVSTAAPAAGLSGRAA